MSVSSVLISMPGSKKEGNMAGASLAVRFETNTEMSLTLGEEAMVAPSMRREEKKRKNMAVADDETFYTRRSMRDGPSL